MHTFHGIGEQASRLAEKANNIHCEIQEWGIPELDETLGEIEDLREELARLATDLGTPSPHDGRS